ncbi:MAG: hypothetical protein ACYCUV_01275 [Phycisphaerae bacterium]
MLSGNTLRFFQRGGRMATHSGDVRFRASALMSFLLLIGLFLWALSFLAFAGNRSVLALASLAFVFGLRHAWMPIISPPLTVLPVGSYAKADSAFPSD